MHFNFNLVILPWLLIITAICLFVAICILSLVIIWILLKSKRFKEKTAKEKLTKRWVSSLFLALIGFGCIGLVTFAIVELGKSYSPGYSSYGFLDPLALVLAVGWVSWILLYPQKVKKSWRIIFEKLHSLIWNE